MDFVAELGRQIAELGAELAELGEGIANVRDEIETLKAEIGGLKMRYIIITLSNGYCGCDEEYCLMFPKETTDENITAYACELLNEYVENYEYLAENDFEDIQAFFENCTLDWIEVFEGDDDFNYHIEEFSLA